MKSVAKICLVVVVNVIVLAVLVEIGGNLFFLQQYGQFFYGRERPKLVSSPDTNPFMTGDFHGVFHPYYGFAYKPNVDLENRLPDLNLNNHGFLNRSDYVRRNPGCCDYPSVRADANELVVGVFGGSVAGALALRLQENTAFADAIKAIPRFAGKRVRVLSFALGGQKQPQQLMILTYYLSLGQPLDVIINVDGINELISGLGLLWSGIDVSYPHVSLWMALVQFFERQAQQAHDPEGMLANYHFVMGQQWTRRATNCQTGTCYTFAKLVQHWHQFGVRDFESPDQAATSSPFFFQVNSSPANTKDMFEVIGGRRVGTRAAYDIIANHWATTSIVMQKIARGYNMLYLHALQPNPWFRQSTPYVPRSPELVYLEHIVPAGYSAFQAKAPRLRDLGVNFLDASAVLDNEPSSIYSDDVGHYMPRGYDLLALAIVQALAEQDIR